MKTSKRIISFVLCALMVASCFFCTGKLPELEAKAATVGNFTQTRVVDQSLYKSYQKKFFLGEETNWPTNFVIPGLSSGEDYTPQGMTYWAEEELILISAYDASGSDPSVIYALDVVTTNLVAVFEIYNADGTANTGHGGGIAASKYNFYYADSASKVSYVPLSEMKGKTGMQTITLKGSVDFAKEMTGSETGETVKTSYCCYDDGILWTGNFNWSGETQYAANYHATYKSVLMGYKLAGNSSEEEWYYLKNGYNLAKITKADGETSATEYTRTASKSTYTGTMKYTKIEIDGAHLEVRGTVESNTTSASQSSSDTRIGEITTPSDVGSFDLVEGTQYKISFVSTNPDTDIYMWSPGGKHCNVKQAQTSSKRQLDDGRWYYEMIFTAGLKPTGADSGWPATQSTDGSYTGTYNFRIDQDNILGSFDFAVTDISVCEYNGASFNINPDYEGVGCAGNPTHVIAMNTDRIQYAMVDKGKLYVSRSWSRSESGNHTRELMIADIDLNRPGDVLYPVNGRNHNIYLINYSDASVTHFGGNYKESDNGVSAEELDKMLWMGEALCVINDYLYMFGEGAAWNYNGKDTSSVCGEPIDVIWKIDQYAIQGLQRPHEDVAAVEYEKVDSLSELNDTDEYIVLYESSIKDSLTQKNVLYLLDSYGGYDEMKLPKKAAADNVTASLTGDSRGIVGYEIRDYSVTIDEETGKEKLILSAEDDANKSLHWQFESGSSTTLKLYNRDLYYAKHPYLYIGDSLLSMTASASSTMNIKDWGNGTFTIYGNGENYSLWCNDGSVPASISAYTNFYGNHGQTGFVPNYHGLEEVAGTFHVTNGTQPALPTNEQQGLQIYKRVSDPYASSYETQVYTDLQAELTSDGTYNITLETYATDSIQYQRVEKRPTDFIFVLDLSGSMDETDARSYQTSSSWSPLKMSQACGDVSNSFFSRGDNYNTAHSGNFWFKFPDGEYGQIHVAFNEKDSSSAYARDIWLWAEHPDTKRCYRLSKYGFMTKGNFAGGADWAQDSAARITDADFLANHLTLGWANEAAVMADVNADINRTDYHGTGYNSTSARAGYEVMNYTCNQDGVVVTASYYTYGASMRTDAVKNAVDALTYKIAAEATDELDHRIAIVSSASDDRGPGYIWTNTGIYTNDSTSLTQYTGEGSISEATYKKAFFTVDEFGEVRTIVSNLKQDGFTYINNGLELAGNIVEASDADYDINGSRSAVVIVISDGAAGGDTLDTIGLTQSTESANGALSAAYDLKRQGAYVFSVRVGDVTSDDEYYVDGFDYDGFMKYLSSKYMGSKSMTDIGPVNPKEYQYYTHVPADDSFNLEYITDTMFNAVTANSVNAISSLTAESILREHLTDAFDTSNASIKFETAQSKYDGIGRLYFEDPVEASGFGFYRNPEDQNEVEITGFDYSANNVSEYNSNLGNGKKLIVTISNVVANRDEELNNTSINDTDYTAIYENSTYKNQNQPVKKFPTYHFSIPEYTFVMDYDLPMLDTDVNGTLCSVDTAPDKQDTYETVLDTDVLRVEFTNNNQDMYYSLNSQEGSTEKNSRAYVLIKRDDGSYDWFRLNLLPASVVYFEEDKTKTVSSTASYGDWTQVGSTAGWYQDATAEGDIFGNDPILAEKTKDFDFSLNTHLETTVTSSAKRSETKTFSFTGTGFDLVSACGPNTGIQTVVVRDANGNLVQTYIVDTYFNDTDYGTIYQAPIVHFEGAYGQYTVETTAAYYSFAGALKTQSVDVNALGDTGIDAYSATAETSVTDEFFAEIGMDELIGQEVELIWMDEESVLNGGMGATEATVSTQAGESTTTPATSLINYIDGFRIYDPLESKDANAYYPLSERNAKHYNLVNNIGSGALEGSSFVGYVEGGGGSFNFADYTSIKGKGPKNEIYLDDTASSGFTFKIHVDISDTTNVKPFLSMRTVSGNPTVVINGIEFNDLSTNERYFNILDAFFAESANMSYVSGSTYSYLITVSLKGAQPGDLVAIGSLRLTHATLVPVSTADLANVAKLMTMSSSPVNYDASKVYSPAPEFVDAPADNPAIDPEGKIPTLEEYLAIHGSGNNGNDHSGADSLADKLIAIVEKVIDFIKKVIALVANTVTNIF